MNGNILIVEDDKNTGFLVKRHLRDAGFKVCLCTDGKEALEYFKQESFDLCILDVMLPSKDGLELSTDIRQRNQTVPIIFLTARNLKSDKIQGYKNGCDDYITKPFDIDELVLKIHAILRRTKLVEKADRELKVSKLSLLTDERLLITATGRLSLSHKEMLLLEYFFKHFNKVVPRSELLMHCWGNDDYFSSNILNVYLTKIRKLIREDEDLKLQNIHGHGYKLTYKETVATPSV